jgi:hypothetical protein
VRLSQDAPGAGAVRTEEMLEKHLPEGYLGCHTGTCVVIHGPIVWFHTVAGVSSAPYG